MSELPDGWTLFLFGEVDLHDSRRIPAKPDESAQAQGCIPYYGANGQVDSINDRVYR